MALNRLWRMGVYVAVLIIAGCGSEPAEKYQPEVRGEFGGGSIPAGGLQDYASGLAEQLLADLYHVSLQLINCWQTRRTMLFSH